MPPPTSALCDLWPFKWHVYYIRTVRTQRISKAKVEGILVFTGVLNRGKRQGHGALMASVTMTEPFRVQVIEMSQVALSREKICFPEYSH